MPDRAAKEARRLNRLVKHERRSAVIAAGPKSEKWSEMQLTDWDLLQEDSAVNHYCLICGGPTCHDDDLEEHCDSCAWVCSGLQDCVCRQCELVERLSAQDLIDHPASSRLVRPVRGARFH